MAGSARLDRQPGPVQQPPRDVHPRLDGERVDHVPFGEGDLGPVDRRARAARRAVATPRAAPAGRDAERQQVPVGQRPRAPTTVAPWTATVTDAPSASAAAMSACAVGRISRSHDPGRERQAGPRRPVDRPRGPSDRRPPGAARRPQRPPAPRPASGSYQPRSTRLPDEPRHDDASNERADRQRPARRPRPVTASSASSSGSSKVVGQRRLPVPSRLVRPSLPPRGRRRRSGPRDAHRPARSGPTPAARPGTRRSRRRRSPAIDRRHGDGRVASTSRAASPIAVVVTARCASGSQACESAPCCDTSTSGPNVAASSGSSERTTAIQAGAPVPAGSGTLTRVPAATPSPDLVDVAGPREEVPARSRGSTRSGRPGRSSGGPGRRRRDGRRGRRTGRAGRRPGPGRWPAPGRRRCRTRTPDRPSRDAGHRPGAGRARRRRAGSPPSPAASRRRPPRRRRACPANGGSSPPSPMPGLAEPVRDRPRSA